MRCLVIELKDIVARMRRLNILLFSSMAGLCVIGVMFVYSACSIRENPEIQIQYMRHAETALFGLLLYLGVACTNYRKVIKWSWLFYLFCLILLIMVPFFGRKIMGARRWIFGVQPSELAKLAMIMMLAWIYGGERKVKGFVYILVSAFIVGLPTLLILVQPDLGTALVMVPTTFAMMFAANIAPRWIWSFFIIGVLAASAMLGMIYAAERIEMPPERQKRLLEATCLQPHQIRRLEAFLFPEKDLYGSGYNRHQSEIAVGSGGLHGKGYLKGEQYMLGYLPPSVASNDFIFAVLAEESGFIGSLTVLLLFLALLVPGLWVAHCCKDNQGRILCVGVMTLIFSHMFINIAMTIGLMPITGLPLPFISYGRTFLLTVMLALGLVQSVSVHGRVAVRSF